MKTKENITITKADMAKMVKNENRDEYSTLDFVKDMAKQAKQQKGDK